MRDPDEIECFVKSYESHVKMSASGQVEMSAFGDVVSLGNRTDGPGAAVANPRIVHTNVRHEVSSFVGHRDIHGLAAALMTRRASSNFTPDMGPPSNPITGTRLAIVMGAPLGHSFAAEAATFEMLFPAAARITAATSFGRDSMGT